MSGDDCLPVCLVLRSVNNMTLVYQCCIALHQASNCEHVFHTYERRQASTLDETLELKKNSTPALAASTFAVSDQSESFIFA